MAGGRVGWNLLAGDVHLVGRLGLVVDLIAVAAGVVVSAQIFLYLLALRWFSVSPIRNQHVILIVKKNSLVLANHTGEPSRLRLLFLLLGPQKLNQSFIILPQVLNRQVTLFYLVAKLENFKPHF